MIEWNEGLSIGIEVLDNDHKQLLKIINNFSSAIDRDVRDSEFEEIFSQLEEYTDKHFVREESFIQKCCPQKYEEHYEQHRHFTEQIPELKKKFFLTDNYIDAKEISIFLTDWLINHIVNEDMHLVKSFDACGLVEKKDNRKTWFNTLMKRVTGKFGFTKRIFISALIPLLGMLFLGFILVLDEYKEYKKVDSVSNMTHIIFYVNNLTHSLQVERGLSSGYLLSKSDTFQKKLEIQKKVVDTFKSSLLKKVASINSEKIRLIMPNIKILETDLGTLESIRKMVKHKKISQSEEMQFYTQMIHNILNITTKIMLINNNKDISHLVSMLSALLNIKEILGQERAYGAGMIEKKEHNKQEHDSFVKLLGVEETFYNILIQSSTLDNKQIIGHVFDTPIAKKILEYEHDFLNHNYKDLDASLWFEIMTEHINSLKLIINSYLLQTKVLVQTNRKDSLTNLLIWSFYTCIVLFITWMMVYLFEQSTKKQILQITSAMKHLALGGRSQLLYSLNDADEISQIYDAYETTRKELLKGDIFTQLYLSKEKIKFDNQKRENLKLEEMAFVDPLTNVVNRRRLEELARREIQRSARYGHKLSFLMLDIDYFKKINDTYGHAVGDEILKEFAKVCQSLARTLDLVARIGGEEFVIMLPETDANGAVQFANRVCKTIYESTLMIQNKEIKYSVSIGVTLYDASDDKNLQDILKRADKALYSAKSAGRNRVEIE